ncbi:MAG: class I SAM-dependent methyltransferase [Thermoanaerobaculia bacterium]
MSERWREIWSARTVPASLILGLSELIELDGFDTGAGRVEVADWRAYARAVAELLRIAAGDSVYEVGCGSGAFLFAIQEFLDVRLAGSDYSPALIEVARRTVAGGDFEVLDAQDVPGAPSYGFVISNSLYQYFPGLAYASRALQRMIAKASRAVAVLDVPDLARRGEAEELRRAALPPDEYARRYSGLEHLHYERDWFRDRAAENGMDCRILSSLLPNSAQSEFRFGAILTRR